MLLSMKNSLPKKEKTLPLREFLAILKLSGINSFTELKVEYASRSCSGLSTKISISLINATQVLPSQTQWGITNSSSDTIADLTQTNRASGIFSSSKSLYHSASDTF